MTATMEEIDVLDAAREQLQSEGFRLDVEQPLSFPAEFGSYRPDFVAKRNGKLVAIEVKRDRKPASWSAIRRLEKLFSKNPDWELYVLFGEDFLPVSALPKVPSDRILASLDEAEKAIDAGHIRAGFLLCWGVFEAIGRGLHGQIFRRPQSPGRIVTVLAERGTLDTNQAEFLRMLIRKRNSLIHGNVEVTPSHNELRGLITLLRDLASKLTPVA